MNNYFFINYTTIRKTIISFFCCIELLLGFGCIIGCADINGSGTGVGNGVIIGKVVFNDSTSVKKATVRLRSESYLADTSGIITSLRTDTTVSLTTDSSGLFTIDSVKKGNTYWIEVLDETHTKGNLGTLYILDYDTVINHDTVRLSTHIVEPLKKIQGTIILYGLPQNAYVMIYGLERVDKTDSLGKFILENLPVGDCEDTVCEYELKVLVPQIDGTLSPYKYELEILRNNADSIIYVECELSDTLDADDFIPAVNFTDSTAILSGFPNGTILSFSDSSTLNVTDSAVVININQLPPDTCINTICDYTIFATIPKSTGILQKNKYLLKITKNTSGYITNIEIQLISI